jgi:uncharacterized protein YndB with AHSA1/START domain
VTEDARVPPIELRVETRADPDTAWRTLTEPARVVLWLTDASTPRRVGEAYRLDFGDGSVVRGEILELVPGRAFAHRWAWEGSDPAEATVVTWTVEAAAGGAVNRSRHDGGAEAGLDAGVRDDHEGYWTGYLEDLRDVLEEA